MYRVDNDLQRGPGSCLLNLCFVYSAVKYIQLDIMLFDAAITQLERLAVIILYVVYAAIKKCRHRKTMCDNEKHPHWVRVLCNR